MEHFGQNGTYFQLKKGISEGSRGWWSVVSGLVGVGGVGTSDGPATGFKAHLEIK